MPGWLAFGMGLLLPLMFWVCRWQGWPFWWCGLLLLPLAWPRRGEGSALTSSSPRFVRWLPGLLAAVIGILALVFHSNISLQYYSVVSSLFFFSLFAASLFQEQTIVERLARRVDPDLPPSAVHYTRRVTQAWCVFCLANTIVTLLCIATSEEAWAIYNGFIAYILVGLMFAGEWLIRRRVMKRARAGDASGLRGAPDA